LALMAVAFASLVVIPSHPLRRRRDDQQFTVYVVIIVVAQRQRRETSHVMQRPAHARRPVATYAAKQGDRRSGTGIRQQRAVDKQMINHKNPLGYRCVYTSTTSLGFPLPAFLRAFSVSNALRNRIDCGVASTSSSSSMYSSACSRVILRGGLRMMFSSRLVVRMLVSCFAVVGLTTMSLSRAFSATTWPS